MNRLLLAQSQEERKQVLPPINPTARKQAVALSLLIWTQTPKIRGERGSAFSQIPLLC